MFQVFRTSTLLVVALFMCAPNPALATLKIETWKTYGNLAEQGAICASFASLMESQSILNADLGALWSERQKYSGTIIRKASEMETGTAVNPAEIDVFIAEYREWVLNSLLAPIAPIDLAQRGGKPLKTGRDRITKLIQTYCLGIYSRGDSVILKRFPHLAYLTNSSENLASQKPRTPDKTTGKTAKTAATKVISSMLNSMRNNESKAPKSMPKKQPVKPIELTSFSAPENPDYVAQLASFSSQKRAETSRNLIIQKFPNAFTSKILQVERHVISSGSHFFRVQTGAITKEKAREYCDILWLQKISCLVRQAQ
jgi:hypothetical protein